MTETNMEANEWDFEKLLGGVDFIQTPDIFLNAEEGTTIELKESGIYGHDVSGGNVVQPEEKKLTKCVTGRVSITYRGSMDIEVPKSLTGINMHSSTIQARTPVLVQGGTFTVVQDSGVERHKIAFLDPKNRTA